MLSTRKDVEMELVMESVMKTARVQGQHRDKASGPR